ncbi:MAG: GYD domain-containing protein [Dehalococcoidia bacterium]|nr:GYD domain-containing protein [Dehalococcoidia bacterium]
MTLTNRGREMALEDPDHLLQVQDNIAVGETRVLGCYAVLGDYDFVSIVNAPDNDSIARFSLELGVRAGVGVVTMPAIPVGRLEEGGDIDLGELERSLERDLPFSEVSG